jgi:tetratricopeptide (TPR) repeat protein
MSYHVLPNIVLILAILGFIAMILRRLPEAVSAREHEQTHETAHEKLSKKGLPVLAVSKAKSIGRFWSQKIWHFVLEAKDLKPTAATGYKIRKMFSHHPEAKQAVGLAQNEAQVVEPTRANEPERPSENEILESIKREPRNHKLYDDLGKLYLEEKKFSDAKDVYLYLVNHESGHSDHHAKLAFSCYQLREFGTAVEHYKKSIALDSTHPNRYYNLALCLSTSGRHEEAIQYFQKAVELEPQNQKYQMALEKAVKAT